MSQTAILGNGGLTVCIDAKADMLGCSWPEVDSPNQLSDLHISPRVRGESRPLSERYVNDRLVETNVSYGDSIFEVRDRVLDAQDVWMRTYKSDCPFDLDLSFTPQLDGRTENQTVYVDAQSQITFGYFRHHWIGISAALDELQEWQCVPRLQNGRPVLPSILTGERIASRKRCGADLRFASTGRTISLYIAFGRSREIVVSHIKSAQTDIAIIASEPISANQDSLSAVRQQSLNVIRILSSRSTGGVIAGPPLAVDIPSEPGYAAVWARDACFTMLGSLASGDFARVRRFIDFAFKVQAPEGLWFHRYHTDHSTGSSWGLHQLDETGSVIHLVDAYCTQVGEWTYGLKHWAAIERAAKFLVSTIESDGLPIRSVDLWEELESKNPYTTASVIGGLKSAANIANHLGINLESSDRWSTLAVEVRDRMLEKMWSPDLGRFYRGIETKVALDLSDDVSRPALVHGNANNSITATAFDPPPTPLISVPNWTTQSSSYMEYDTGLDVSFLGLVFPFGVLSPNDPRIRSHLKQIRRSLWAPSVGGFKRYEGDTYGGGNPWPLATMWIACCATAMGDSDLAEGLLQWVIDHTGPNRMISEQVHKETGRPVAALPMAWAHGMVLVTAAAIRSNQVWVTDASAR